MFYYLLTELNSVARSRLNDMHYTKNQQVIEDIRLVFNNCYSVRNRFSVLKNISYFKIISVQHGGRRGVRMCGEVREIFRQTTQISWS